MGVYSRLVKSNEPRLKKRFGQHFLRDTGVLDRIVRCIQPASNDFFLDIGAGDGVLSASLAPNVARLIAVEVDVDCIKPLESALSRFETAMVVAGDILQLDLAQLIFPYLKPGQRLRVAGNLPYNIATAIIEKLLHARLPIEDMSLMVQLEVGQRITALPGSRKYGFLSVHCQHHSRVRMGFKVSPACFAPRPRVYSAMIFLHPKPVWQEACVESDFEALAKAAFAYRRKTLENSFLRHPAFGKIAHSLLNRAGIDGSKRAEHVSVREYEHLAQVYHIEFEVR
jgi:16S rRNA (adenine1518-N6/adenine1519-N6)-dimethyltransferase